MNTLKRRTLALVLAAMVFFNSVLPIAMSASFQANATFRVQEVLPLQSYGHGLPDPGMRIACDGCSGNGGGPS